MEAGSKSTSLCLRELGSGHLLDLLLLESVGEGGLESTFLAPFQLSCICATVFPLRTQFIDPRKGLRSFPLQDCSSMWLHMILLLFWRKQMCDTVTGADSMGSPVLKTVHLCPF